MNASALGAVFLVSASPALAQTLRDWPPPQTCYRLVAEWPTDRAVAARDSLLKPIRFTLRLSPSNPAVLNIASFRADSAARMDSALSIWHWEHGWIRLESRAKSDSVSLSLSFAADSLVHGVAERHVIGETSSTATVTGQRVDCGSEPH